MIKSFAITRPYTGVFLEDREPQPGTGQLLCRPLAVGLCGSDRQLFAGQMPRVQYPRIPCHEVAAVVISNPTDSAIKTGTVVCVDPYMSCGECHACRLGRTNSCQFNQTLGVQRDGILRERFLVDVDRVHTVPPEVEPRLFFLAEPLAVALHIVDRAGDVEGRWCLVAGVGTVGGLVIRVLRNRRARIIAWSRSPSPARIREMRLLGAEAVIDASDPAAKEQVLEMTRREGVSVAFETGGESRGIEICLELAAYAGKVILVGHSKGVSHLYGSEIVFKELEILGSRNSVGQFPRAVEMLISDPDFWQGIISHRFPFERALDAFHLTQGQDVFRPGKIVIDFPF